ncbi:MAG: hypothetical protein EOP11_11385 [Proteobacteria bacterium]|nr:MAG: hypothetical protein EOP11_11385 [Pseudomonadota bacterium]
MSKAPLVALALLLGACVILGGAANLALRPGEVITAPRFARVAEGFDQFLRRDVKSAAAAKRKQLFWIENTGGEGYALDVLQSPELFAGIFPGYPEAMRLDAGLWHEYFQRTFEIDTFSGEIARAYGSEFNVILSWVGCLDIYERYGADLVVMGTSETFRSVVADELAQGIAKARGGSVPRVLLCTASAMQLDTATELTLRLKAARPDLSPEILFGLSLPVSFVEGRRNLRNGAEKRDTLAAFELQRARSRAGFVKFFETYHEVSFADLFPKITWDNVFPITARGIAENEWIRGYEAATRETEKDRAKGGYVPSALKADGPALAADIAGRMKPYYRVYDDYSDEKHCQSAPRRDALAKLGDAFHALGGKVNLFIPPTTPLAFLAATECFRQEVAVDLRALGTTLHGPVRTDSWEAYGLSYADYVRPTFHPGAYKVDIQHTNYLGASKVTGSLATWMSGETR